MKNVLSLSGLVLILLLANGVAHPQQTSQDILINKASQYFKYVKNRDFYNAATLFHFPKHYSQKERKDDVHAVSKTLELFADKFGNILVANLNQTPNPFYHVMTGGGDLRYWQKHPSSIKVIYEVTFEKESKGYVGLSFCNIDGNWEIRQVAYGIPAARSDARARITIIQKEMTQLIQSLSKQ